MQVLAILRPSTCAAWGTTPRATSTWSRRRSSSRSPIASGYYGDAAGVRSPLIAPAYARERAALIRTDRPPRQPPPAIPGYGTPAADGRRAAARRAPAPAADGTTHIAALDRDGNMIACTPSGGVFRKSAFSPELGCTLSTRSEMFVLEDGHPNALAPGKRPRTTLSATSCARTACP